MLITDLLLLSNGRELQLWWAGDGLVPISTPSPDGHQECASLALALTTYSYMILGNSCNLSNSQHLIWKAEK